MPPDIPPGFTRISGKRSPPRNDTRYHIMLRSGFIDTRVGYTAAQLNWIHEGHSGDIIAIREAK